MRAVRIHKPGLNRFAHGYLCIVISTRLFFCRPSGSSDPSGFWFGATGLAAPKPAVRTLPSGIPFTTIHDFTDAARRSDNFRLDDCDPLASVYPSTSTFGLVVFLIRAAICSSVGPAA